MRPITLLMTVSICLSSICWCDIRSTKAQEPPAGILGAAQKQKDRQLRPQRFYLVQLLMAPPIIETLELDAEQKAALDKMRLQLSEKMREPQRTAFAIRSEKSEEKRSKVLAECQDTINAAFDESDDLIEEVLDFEQLARLKGIYLQRLGFQALLQDWVRDELGMPEATRKKVDALFQEESEKVKKKVVEMAERQEHQQIREYIVEANKDLGEKLMGMLTADQKAKLDVMRGEIFDFSSLSVQQGQLGEAG